MKTTICLIFAITLLFTSSSYAQQRGLGLDRSNASSNRRIALVIGNGTYTSAPLKNPPNDATDMAAALSKVGFSVEHGLNLTQQQMKAMIREFGQKLKGGGQGLFYFAGHGVQLKGRNYLIPVDAEIASEADAEDQGVDANLVLNLMDEAGNGLNVVILDACRNNPFARSFRSASNGLVQVDAPTGTLVAYSTAPGRVARDGMGRNGAYTAELLKHMSVPGLPIEEVMKRVRAGLKQQTKGEQVPWESSSLVGDFYFNGTGKGSSTGTVNAGGDDATPQSNSNQTVSNSPQPTITEPNASDVLSTRRLAKQKQDALNQLLIDGIRENYIDVVQSAIKDGAQVKGIDPKTGKPIFVAALEVAAKTDDNNVLKVILSAGLDPNQLFKVCMLELQCSDATKITIIEAGADVNAWLPYSIGGGKFQSIFIEARLNKVALVKALIKAGADINYEGPNTNLLGYVVESCDLEMVKLLVDAGANVNHRKFGSSVFNFAERNCKEAIPILKRKR